jgi:hypothetical protein
LPPEKPDCGSRDDEPLIQNDFAKIKIAPTLEENPAGRNHFGAVNTGEIYR